MLSSSAFRYVSRRAESDGRPNITPQRQEQMMRREFSATQAMIRDGDEETRRTLTERMESLFDANERHMRLLHEDLVQRIATGNEGR